MKRFTALALALIFSSVLFAQDNAENKVYKYVLNRNDPEYAPNIMIGLDPLIVNVNEYNPTLGAGASGSVRVVSRVQLDVSYQRAYLHINEDDLHTKPGHAFSIYKTSPANSFDGVLKVFWFKDLEETEESIWLETSNRVEYHTNIPYDILRLVGGRFGYTKGVTFVAHDHAIYKGYNINDPAKTVKEFSGIGFSNIVEYSYISIGVSYTWIKDLEVTFEELGTRGVESGSELYGDVIFATRLQLDDMWIPEEYTGFYTNYQQYHVDEHTPKIKAGAKIGWQYSGLSRFNIKGGIEGGVNPGLTKGSPNFFFLFRAGALLAFNTD